jgi:hypothetical protein
MQPFGLQGRSTALALFLGLQCHGGTGSINPDGSLADELSGLHPAVEILRVDDLQGS